MPFTTTAKHALRRLTGSSNISDIDAGFAALADDIDVKMAVAEAGTGGARPASTPGSPGKLGRIYSPTDAPRVDFDTGSSWRELVSDVIRGGIRVDGTPRTGSGGTLVTTGGFTVLASPPTEYLITLTTPLPRGYTVQLTPVYTAFAFPALALEVVSSSQFRVYFRNALTGASMPGGAAFDFAVFPN